MKILLVFILFVQNAYALNDVSQLNKSQVVDLNNKTFNFDARALFGSTNHDIDLHQLENIQNIIPTGIYSFSTSINNERSLGQLTLKFNYNNVTRKSEICITASILERLDLRQEVLKYLPKRECLTIMDISPDAYYDLDYNNLTLNFSLPVGLLNYRPDGYIEPERFDKGVVSAYLGYDFNTYTNKQKEVKDVISNYLNLTGGFNIAGFNYRHAGSFFSNSKNFDQYSSSLNTLSTDILPLKSRLTVGDFSTQSYYIDAAQIIGLELASDIAMRPMSQRTYAPIIRGVANTNALISVFQNGRKIYERNVPAGIFEFNNLTAMDNLGDLTVEVIESNGEKNRFIVPMQSNMSLIRQGQFNYNIAFGRYKFNQKIIDDYISQFSFEYGLSNYLSIYAGTNQSPLFKSYLLGFGANTLLGGISLDIEQSDALLVQNYVGQKYNFSYRYNLAPSNTSINLSTQYQKREYMTLGNTMSLLNFYNLSQAEIDNFFQSYHLKWQTNLSLHQSFPKNNWGAFYINTSTRKYWNLNKDYQQYDFGYANHLNKLTYSLGYIQLENHINNETEKRFYLSLSMPLDWSNKRVNINSNVQHSNNSGYPTIANWGLTGTIGNNNYIDYSLTNNKSWAEFDNRSSTSLSMNYRLPQIQLGTIAGWSDDQSQYGLNARGALVVHPYGVSATNNLSDTFTIIHAEGAKGADVTNAWGTKVDRFGNAIYANLSPYEVNSIGLDTKHLPVDIQLSSNQATVIPRRYSSTLLTFDTVKTSNILLNAVLEKGQQIPIGVKAISEDGEIVGMFGQSNQLFVENADLLQKDIIVNWGVKDLKTCRISAPKQQLREDQNKTEFQTINVECK